MTELDWKERNKEGDRDNGRQEKKLNEIEKEYNNFRKIVWSEKKKWGGGNGEINLRR